MMTLEMVMIKFKRF